MLLPDQVRRGVPEEQKHHGGGVQALLCCNLGCREHGHSSKETNHLVLPASFCFLGRYIKKIRAVREIQEFLKSSGTLEDV